MLSFLWGNIVRFDRMLARALSCLLSLLLISGLGPTGVLALAEESVVTSVVASRPVSEPDDSGDDDVSGDGRDDAICVDGAGNGRDDDDVIDDVVLPDDVDDTDAEGADDTDDVVNDATSSDDTDAKDADDAVVPPTSVEVGARGDGFSVTVSFDADAGLGKDTDVRVTELPDDSAGFADAMSDVIGLLDAESTYKVRVLDIELEDGGDVVEPSGPVLVSVTLNDMGVSGTHVAHLVDDGPEVLPTVASDGSFEFVTGSFSRYVFYEVVGDKGTLVEDLDGFACPLLVERKASAAQYGLIEAEPKTFSGIHGLRATEVDNAGTYYSDGRLRYVSDGSETVWHFEAVDADARPGTYYVWAEVDGERQYMTIEPRRGGNITLSATAGAAQEIDVVRDDGGLVRLDHGGFAPNLKRDSFSEGFQAGDYHGASERVILGEPITQQAFAYAADVSDLYAELRVLGEDGSAGDPEHVVIYSEYDKPDGSRGYVALGHDGTLTEVTIHGDRVWWEQPVVEGGGTPTWDENDLWVLVEYVDSLDGDAHAPTGYYELQSVEGDVYVAPSHDGIISDSPIGLVLAGRADGTAYTEVTAWDEVAGRHFGLGVDVENMVATSEPGKGVRWSVATIEPPRGDPEPISPNLHAIETVSPSNVTMSLFDFDASWQNEVIGTTAYTPTHAQVGLLSPLLDEDGWPTATRSGVNLSELYTSSAKVGEAANLFSKHVYDATGVYEYDSRENYAWFDAEEGSWEVYRELGTGTASDLVYGNFLPLNSIRNASSKTNRNTAVGEDEPRYGERVYISADPINYQFGMRMDVSFCLAPGGVTELGDRMFYEFSGDDDLWVYVDDVLVLDLGGIHSRLGSSIDFSTGVVRRTAQEDTTLFDVFRDAGVFPNGDAWDDAEVSRHFAMSWDEEAGEFVGTPTFADYTGHSLTMFYMERGGHASNLRMNFNLPHSEPDEFTVEKTLGDEVDERYAAMEFAFQAMVTDVAHGTERTLDAATLDDTDEAVEFVDTTIDGVEYEDVFFLRPGQSATFRAMAKHHYRVRELGVSASDFDTVLVNDVAWDGDAGEVPSDGVVSSSSDVVEYRPRVRFENVPSHEALRDIEIEKRLADGTTGADGDTFEFYVFVESPDPETGESRLVPYASAPYLLRSPVGRYCQGLEDGMPVEVSDESVTYERSGPYGTIAGVPVGYTVVIPDVMAGTEFLVEERTSRLDGYELVSCELGEDEGHHSDEASLSGQRVSVDGVLVTRDAMGAVASGSDSLVVVTNRATGRMSATKVWVDGAGVAGHAPVTLALFSSDGSRMVEGSEREVSGPTWSASWDVAHPERHVVREVAFAQGEAVAVGEGATVSCDVTLEGGGEASLPYLAGYEVVASGGGTVTTVTNRYEPGGVALPDTGMGGMGSASVACGVTLVVVSCCEVVRRRLERARLEER